MSKTETWIIYIGGSEPRQKIQTFVNRKVDSRVGVVPYAEIFSDGYEHAVEIMFRDEEGVEAYEYAERTIDEFEDEFDVLDAEFVTSGTVSF